MSGETHQAVVAAIVGNLAIAATKLVAAAFSGSASMLSEAIHSIVDTGNGALMLHGIRVAGSHPTTSIRLATATSSISGRSWSAC